MKILDSIRGIKINSRKIKGIEMWQKRWPRDRGGCKVTNRKLRTWRTDIKLTRKNLKIKKRTKKECLKQFWYIKWFDTRDEMSDSRQLHFSRFNRVKQVTEWDLYKENTEVTIWYTLFYITTCLTLLTDGNIQNWCENINWKLIYFVSVSAAVLYYSTKKI